MGDLKPLLTKISNFNNIIDTQIGFEIEFGSKQEVSFLIENLNELLEEKNIEFQKLGKRKKFKGEVLLRELWSPTETFFELVLPPCSYYDAISKLSLVIDFINEHGYTTDYTAIHVNVSGNNLKLSEMLDKFKLSLMIDEDFIYENFPQRKKNFNSRPTFENVFFMNITNVDHIEKIHTNLIPLPEDKSHGINFGKVKHNYIEFRYLGGENYHQKYKEIKRVIEHFVFCFWESSKKSKLTDQEKDKFYQNLKKAKEKVYASRNYNNFVESYPKIELMANLSKNPEVVKSFFHTILKNIYYWFPYPGQWDFQVNYDSDLNVIQVKDAYLMDLVSVGNVEFYNSTLRGSFSNCRFENCEIRNSFIYDSKLYRGKVNKTQIFDSELHLRGKMKNSLLVNSISSFFVENSSLIKSEITDEGLVKEKVKIIEDKE